MERTLIAPGVHLSCDPAEKFNRCRISIHFAFPAQRATATAHALLPLVLERGYALVLDGGRVLPDRAAARTHPQMTIRFRDGEMRVMQPNKEGAYGSEKKLTFEERLQQVEALIAKMESGEMPLEEAMQQYEAGLNALNALEKELTAAQQRLTVLRQQSGEDIEVPMEEQQ